MVKSITELIYMLEVARDNINLVYRELDIDNLLGRALDCIRITIKELENER